MKTSIIEQSQNQPWMTDLKKLQEATGGVLQKKLPNIDVSIKKLDRQKNCHQSNN